MIAQVVIEQKPQYRTILNSRGDSFYISIPDVVFVIKFLQNGPKIIFGRPLTKDLVCGTTLHSYVYVDCGSWLDSFKDFKPRTLKQAKVLAHEIVSIFWQSSFEIDKLLDEVIIPFNGEVELVPAYEVYSIKRKRIVSKSTVIKHIKHIKPEQLLYLYMSDSEYYDELKSLLETFDKDKELEVFTALIWSAYFCHNTHIELLINYIKDNNIEMLYSYWRKFLTTAAYSGYDDAVIEFIDKFDFPCIKGTTVLSKNLNTYGSLIHQILSSARLGKKFDCMMALLVKYKKHLKEEVLVNLLLETSNINQPKLTKEISEQCPKHVIQKAIEYSEYTAAHFNCVRNSINLWRETIHET